MRPIIQTLIPFNEINFYPFDWLDDLLEIKMNPESSLYRMISADDLKAWDLESVVQMGRITRTLRQQVFGETTISKIKPIVEQYLETINELLSLAGDNLRYTEATTEAHTFLQTLIIRLIELQNRIRKRYEKCLTNGSKQSETRQYIPSKIHKLICNLSADQVGIILKAADDTKLVSASSISMVYKTLIPYLSTTYKTDLSWNSVRSNSYHPEQADKDIVIAALEKLIHTIRAYH